MCGNNFSDSPTITNDLYSTEKSQQFCTTNLYHTQLSKANNVRTRELCDLHFDINTDNGIDSNINIGKINTDASTVSSAHACYVSFLPGVFSFKLSVCVFFSKTRWHSPVDNRPSTG